MARLPTAAAPVDTVGAIPVAAEGTSVSGTSARTVLSCTARGKASGPSTGRSVPASRSLHSSPVLRHILTPLSTSTLYAAATNLLRTSVSSDSAAHIRLATATTPPRRHQQARPQIGLGMSGLPYSRAREGTRRQLVAGDCKGSRHVPGPPNKLRQLCSTTPVRFVEGC